MMRNCCSKVRVTIVALALLSSCGPATAPTTSAPVSAETPSERPTQVREPTLSTTALDLEAISPRNAKDVALFRAFRGHTSRVLDVAFTAQGQYLVSSGQDLSIRVWDIGSGREAHAFRMRSVDMADLDIWTEENLLASAEGIWDLDTMEQVRALERGSPFPGSVAFSPDGSVLALGLFERQITLWDVAGGQRLRSLETREENRTKSMDFSPDGLMLAAGVIDGTVRVFDLASGKIVRVLQYAGETDIHHLMFSPDGKYLATGGRVPAIILWDVATWHVVRTFSLTDNSMSVAFSPDGAILASAGGNEHKVRLWDVESGELLHALKHPDQLMRVAFSPDAMLLATACFDGQVYLWGIRAEP